jgi:hypothetical protein
VWQIGGHYQGGIILSPAFFVAEGALGLLTGEADGFAIDATTADGGTVAVIDTGTPANDLSNVILDASNLAQAGTSPKMVHHLSSPYVRWSAHNMFLNSGTPATQNVTLVVGFVYTVTVTGAGGGDITGSAGASGTATTGSPATFTATTTTGTFTLTGSLDTIQLNRGTVATPYVATTGTIRIGIPQSYDAAAAQYGVLVEPAATNVCLQSEAMATTWTNNNATITSNTTTAPDGTSTADKVAGDGTGSNNHGIYQTGITTSVATGTISVFMKQADTQYVSVRVGDSTNATRWGASIFDLSGGSVTQNGNGAGASSQSSSITSIGDGWYHCTVTVTLSAGSVEFAGINPFNASTTIFVSYGDTGLTNISTGIYCWGAQLEAGSAATSYIPTVGATATRAADRITAVNSTIPYSATAGTLVFYGKVLVDAGNFPIIHAFDDGTTNERIVCYQETTADQFTFFIADGGVSQIGDLAPGSNPGLSIGTAYKAASAWAVNDAAVVKDGGTAGVDATLTLPTPTTFRLGYDMANPGVADSNMMVYQVTYLPRRATNTELQAKTT